jgi:N-acetyl sugar amidotransferase
MDTSDPEITFDREGVCSHCRAYDQIARPVVERAKTPEGRQQLEELVAQIKREGEGKEYDCLIGISGGVDSTYVAWQTRRLGLRPLAVHFDSGWNSELAVNNIENVVKKLGIDLHTFVMDWEEMRDLQLAFFKASLANCDVPTDHAFYAVLHRTAVQHGIKTIISGGNAATEFILPRSWGYNASDLRHLRAVHRRYGTRKLATYPTLGFFRRYIWNPYVLGIRTVRILDYLPYNKEKAKRLIADELGWRDYGGKHYESVFTRFFQAYYLPTKFGFDKRRAHLSSLIVSGQMGREDALAELLLPPDSTQKMKDDKEFVAKKLGISVGEFDAILNLPTGSHRELPSQEWLFRAKERLQASLKRFAPRHAV